VCDCVDGDWRRQSKFQGKIICWLVAAKEDTYRKEAGGENGGKSGRVACGSGSYNRRPRDLSARHCKTGGLGFKWDKMIWGWPERSLAQTKESIKSYITVASGGYKDELNDVVKEAVHLRWNAWNSHGAERPTAVTGLEAGSTLRERRTRAASWC
jgi:hypothetical protein